MGKFRKLHWRATQNTFQRFGFFCYQKLPICVVTYLWEREVWQRRSSNLYIYMMTSLKKAFSATLFLLSPCRFLTPGLMGPLVEFLLNSWHQRRCRFLPKVIYHLSLQTRATFRRGDVSKGGVTQIKASRIQIKAFPIQIKQLSSI